MKANIIQVTVSPNDIEMMKREVFKAQRAGVFFVEPELDELAAAWGAAKRRETAWKLARWVVQLNFSADLMDGGNWVDPCLRN